MKVESTLELNEWISLVLQMGISGLIIYFTPATIEWFIFGLLVIIGLKIDKN